MKPRIYVNAILEVRRMEEHIDELELELSRAKSWIGYYHNMLQSLVEHHPELHKEVIEYWKN